MNFFTFFVKELLKNKFAEVELIKTMGERMKYEQEIEEKFKQEQMEEENELNENNELLKNNPDLKISYTPISHFYSDFIDAIQNGKGKGWQRWNHY